MQSNPLGGFILFFGTIIVIGLLIRLFTRRNRSSATTALTHVDTAPQATVALADSASRAERLAAVDQFHANELNAIEVHIGHCRAIPSKSFDQAAVVFNEKASGKSRNDEPNSTGNVGADAVFGFVGAMSEATRHSSAIGALKNAMVRRTLRDMTDAERGLLRLTDMLQEVGQLTPEEALAIKIPVVWNKGSCLYGSPGQDSAARRGGLKEGLTLLLDGHFGDVATASELTQTALRRALEPTSTPAEGERHLFEAYLFAGSRWLGPQEATVPNPTSTALLLGTFEGTDTDLVYDRRESLITIAPPGSGKSQAHVLRNLLHLRGPAVVLDIKMEAFRNTAHWRRENVGPLFAFAPTMPKGSMHYNPLDAVSADPDRAWDDARKLADLLVIPSRSDPYFESRGRDLLTVAILDVALNEQPGRRNMASILDRLYLNESEFDDWMDHLEESGSPQLVRQSAAWRTMPIKQREGIFDTARNQLEVWQSPALAGLIDRTDWTSVDLREQNGTLYLCVNLEDVKKYAPVLRVIIGQTVTHLCRGEAEADAPIVTFFLDELPRLGRMDVIEEALDVGRGHGVRLWMFCQNIGQLRTAYPNSDGMIGNCAARCFMDPDDETAEELSRYLGHRKGLLDGKQKPLAEPTDLKGPSFADKIIVYQRGKHPAKLVRRMAFETSLKAAE